MLVALWLCPISLNPTPSVPPLLWGGACLALLLIIGKQPKTTYFAPQLRGFYALLLLLGGMMAWRSPNAPNAIAGLLSLASIGLAAHLAANLGAISAARLLAWGSLLGGLCNALLALVQYLGWTAEPAGTAFGLLRQRNQMATLCNISLLALLYLWLQTPKRFFNAVTPLLAGFSTFILTAALAATASRTGLLQLVAGLVAIGIHSATAYPHDRWRLLAAAGLAVLGYVGSAVLLPWLTQMPETVLARINYTADMALAAQSQLGDSRRPLWQNTSVLIAQSPWWGVGWRELAYALRMTDFGAAPRFPDQADNAHNLPLQLAAELGLPFAVLWLGGLAVGCLRLKPWRAHAAHQRLAWGVLAVIGIHSLLEYPLWYAPFQITLGLAVGLALANATPLTTPLTTPLVTPSSAPSSPKNRVQQGVGVVLLLFYAYAAFDYHRISQLFLPVTERSALYRDGAMAKAQASWLFAAQVRYAQLNTTALTPANAAQQYQLAKEVLHFSPEPRVFNILIASGTMLQAQEFRHDLDAELVVYRRQLHLITLE